MAIKQEVLQALRESDKPLTAKVIAEMIREKSISVSKALSDLTKEGNVQRIAYGKYVIAENALENSEIERLAKEAHRQYQRDYYRKHKEKMKEYQARYWRRKALRQKQLETEKEHKDI